MLSHRDPLQNQTRSVSSAFLGVLFLVYSVGVKIQEVMVATRKKSVFPTTCRLRGLRVQAQLDRWGKVKPRLASTSASSLPLVAFVVVGGGGSVFGVSVVVFLFCCFCFVVFVFVVVIVVVVYLKRLRIVLRCAKAGCGRRKSSS